MRLFVLAAILGLLAGPAWTTSAGELALIPLPQKMQPHDGIFKLAPDTPVFADSAALETGNYLAAQLHRATGYSLKVQTSASLTVATRGSIQFITQAAETNLGPEGYTLTVTPDSVVISAPSPAGLFYGVQTLMQLLPPEIFSTNVITNRDWQVPCVAITDWPRFKWRGLMLDVCRHFYNKQEVETLLDAMALHKINTFHWHLTDDQGWRIEIKKYPDLTRIGAWRAAVGFGLASNSTTAYGPDGRYGGFYTQDDIREMVAYAAERHITIVPEIEMPGHATAALCAYPQFSCTGGPFTMPLRGGVFDGIYSPAKPETFQFLQDVLTEVFQLFPGKYIHVGGDEVPKDTWKNDPACQALMKQEGLKDENQLQSWFIRRMEKFVNAQGHTLIGWSEILQGGLSPNAVVMDWIGGGREAATAGHDVVMTPMRNCYFDHYQSTNHDTEPRAIGGYLPLSQVYALEPVPAGLPSEFQSHILGAQGNVWTEYIPNLQHVEYMIFPRLSALAEVTWSARAARNFTDFQHRLQTDDRRLDAMGVNYRHDSTGTSE